MSRTDAHTPYWVRERDPYWRKCFAEHHNHTKGYCDLDEYISAHEWIRTQCRLDLIWMPNMCGCHLCTGRDGGRLRTRQERVQWRKIKRDLLKDSTIEDVPPIRGKAW